MAAKHKTRSARDALAMKLVSTALASSEFGDALVEAADEIESDVQRDDTEASVAAIFERVLYVQLKTVGIQFRPKKETLVETKRHVGRGQTDSRIGQLVFEYKRPKKFERASDVAAACRQTEAYLKDLAKDGASAVGLVTDGRTICEIRALDGRIESRGARVPLDANALRRVVRHVHSLTLTALTADNLLRDLCQGGDGALFRAARGLYTVLDGTAVTSRTELLHAEWRAMYRLGHRDESQQRKIEQRRTSLAELFGVRLADPKMEYRALFALHTAYAIVLKLLATRVLSEVVFARKLTSWGSQLAADAPALGAFCAKLEDGSLFRRLGILNLLEGDFFAWYADKEQWNEEIADAVADVIEVLARYEATAELFGEAGAVDLFRRLYESTVPQVVRASFGEFHTPNWLAEDLLDAAAFGNNARILDPCVGSGTVAIAAIDQVRRKHRRLAPAALLEKVIDSVVGIDLNPLSVLTTRVNYFIRIADLLPEDGASLVIPVFLGDASHVPRRVSIDGVECVEYELKTTNDSIRAVLPLSLVARSASFVPTMHAFEEAVNRKDRSQAAETLVEALPASEQTDQIRALIRQLATRLVTFHGRGRNGIWARVLTNFLSTGALAPFDVVAGNPPWIDWKNLPVEYRDEIKALAIEQHLFSGDRRTGGINLNICALIAHVSMTTWLKKRGRLAFLMPAELAVQQSYQGWRSLAGRPDLTFTEFRDWSAAGHPFDPVKEDFMTFVIGPGRRSTDVPVVSYRKRRDRRTAAASWPDRRSALAALDVTPGVAAQITPESTAFTFAKTKTMLKTFKRIAGTCPYKGREGIEFYPQELLLYEYVGPGPKKGTAWVRNVQVSRSKYRIGEEKRPLETSFLFPLVKGPQIGAFSHAYDGLLVAFPYDAADPHKPIPERTLAERAPLLLEMYQEFEETIRAQTGFSDSIRGPAPGEYYGLARTGPYSFANTYVAFRDNSKWCACVIDSTVTPWGERKRFVFQNHAVSICERQNGRFVGREEAHYVCAILNAPSVAGFILASSDPRSFKIRPPVRIPPFDRGVAAHRLLAKLSRRAHAQPQLLDELLAEIDDVYGELIKQRRR